MTKLKGLGALASLFTLLAAFGCSEDSPVQPYTEDLRHFMLGLEVLGYFDDDSLLPEELRAATLGTGSLVLDFNTPNAYGTEANISGNYAMDSSLCGISFNIAGYEFKTSSASDNFGVLIYNYSGPDDDNEDSISIRNTTGNITTIPGLVIEEIWWRLGGSGFEVISTAELSETGIRVSDWSSRILNISGHSTEDIEKTFIIAADVISCEEVR